MLLFCCDKALTLQGVVEEYTSLRWHRRFYQPGEFEMHIPFTKERLALFQDDRILIRRDAPEAGLIEYAGLELKNGTDVITVKGRFLSAVLDRRTVNDTSKINGRAEAAMHSAVIAHAINPTDAARKLEGIVDGTDSGTATTITAQMTDKNLLDYLTMLSKATNIGYRLRPSRVDRCIYFETYSGHDRTASATRGERAIFSDEKKNISESLYIHNIKPLKNFAVVKGEGTGAARTKVTVGSASGWTRRELFVDARDLSSEDLTTAQYAAVLRDRGNQKLTDNGVEETFEGVIDQNNNLVYRRDYDLGDVVTVANKRWNLTTDARVTEAIEVYEGGQKKISITFGTPAPAGLADLLKEE